MLLFLHQRKVNRPPTWSDPPPATMQAATSTWRAQQLVLGILKLNLHVVLSEPDQ